MVKKVIWTPEAEQTFDAVIIYLEKHWGKAELQKFLDRVNQVIVNVSHHPQAYRSAGKKDIREALITKQNLLLYRVTKNSVYLIYFWDTRRNPSKKKFQ